MHERDWLAEEFEKHRPHLRAVAYRMLGSLAEADDAVQEAWLRLARSDADEIDNLGGWLTTVVGRVALDTLAPAERLAFVLHDLFAVPFEQIAPIVDRTPTAARQLASRARRRVQGAATVPDADVARQREIVEAFLAASRGGDFDALLELLDPEVVLRADRVAEATGADREVHGARGVAEVFLGRARVAEPVLVNGVVGAMWAKDGRPRAVFGFTIQDGRIVAIGIVMDPERLGQLDLVELS